MSQRQILIVDDDDLLSEMLRLTLELEGFAVATALNGGEGLELVRARKFDLIILDLVMPKMDGVKFLRIMNDTVKSRPPVLVISASAGNLLGDQHRALGVVGVARKPLDPAGLISRINAVLDDPNRA
jgi:DNA-binding response OmpR family regulator